MTGVQTCALPISGTVHEETLTPTYDGAATDERGVAMPQPGTARAVSLAVFTTAMHDATKLYGDDPEGAVAVLEPALARLGADAAATNDDELAKEAEFWAALLSLMKSNAPQGDLYGDY